MWGKTSPFSASSIRDRAMHLYMSPYIALVRSSVTAHGGAVTFKFSQSKGAFNREIMKHRGTSGGVCKSLVAQWLLGRADGEPLPDRLYPGGRRARLNNRVVRSLKALAIAGYEADDQDSLTTRWLNEESGGRFYTGGYEAFEERTDDAGPEGMLDRILQTKIKNQQQFFKIIDFHGRLVNHAVGIHISARDGVTWFDPNFGEFHFPQQEQFRRWFLDAYWPRSGYRWPVIGLGRKFSVLSYVYLPNAPTTHATDQPGS
jgi:YopT peptidase